MVSKVTDLPARVQQRIVVDDNGCWLWCGNITPSGYGRMVTKDVTGRQGYHLAHRLVASFLGMPLADHMHHKCHVTRCVNPEHLEPLTVKEHAAIHAAERIKTHCKNGHSMDDAYEVRRGLRSGGPITVVRMCSGCLRERARAHYRDFTPEERTADIARRSEQRRQHKREQRSLVG